MPPYIPDILPEDDLAYFEKGGLGTDRGWGDTPALVVVDMTNEFTSSEYAAGRGDTGAVALDAVERLLGVARDLPTPVVYTKPDAYLPDGYTGTTKSPTNREQRRGEANEIPNRIAPRPDDIVVEKPRASAFFDTHLASMLHEYGVDTLVVTGMTTSGCVRATVVDAHSHNFRTIVPEQGVADRGIGSHELSLFDMSMKYADVEDVETVREKLAARA